MYVYKKSIDLFDKAKLKYTKAQKVVKKTREGEERGVWNLICKYLPSMMLPKNRSQTPKKKHPFFYKITDVVSSMKSECGGGLREKKEDFFSATLQGLYVER